MNVKQEDVAHWQQWVGKQESRSETLDPEALRRFAAAIGEPLDVDKIRPSMAHWAYFLPVAAADQIGIDGHPKRGGFMPPITLPRRMFASADISFDGPLALGQPAERSSVIIDVTHKSGRSGDLVLVKVGHRISQGGKVRVRETQTIVYRDAGGTTPPVVPGNVEQAEGDAPWSPSPVDLFRFSAVTFNSHRIHYDLPYATGEEGYPNLVIHGPFTATRLLGHARSGGRKPRGFSFRAVAPLFCGQPVLLSDDGAGTCRAIRCDGNDAMVATVRY